MHSLGLSNQAQAKGKADDSREKNNLSRRFAFNIALFLSSFCSVSAGQTHQPRYDPTMNISKAFSLLLALAARATNAQRDRDIEKSTNMI
eukprot:scaffold15936_cov72-Cyclotella_meneghiniana.AAC.1